MARVGYKVATYTWQGKRHYCYAPTKEEAKTKADRELALLEANVRTSKSNYTVESWAKKWLHDYKKGAVGDAWYRQIESAIRLHILPYIGDMLMRDVSASDIQRLMNRCSDYSDSHQKKIAQILLQIFDSAVENDVVVKVPIRRIKTSQRANRGRTRAISDEERKLTLTTADKYPEDGMLFLIMLFCGLRPGEVARLRMGDYDKGQRVIFVHEARKADGSVGKPKSESGTRLIPVPEYLAERLDRLGKNADELIVTSAQGKPLTKTSQKRLWHRFKREMDTENGAMVFRGGIVKSTLADDPSNPWLL